MSSGVNGLVFNGPPFHHLAGTCVVALLSLLKPSFQGVALLGPKPPVHLLGVGAVQQSPALPRVWGEAKKGIESKLRRWNVESVGSTELSMLSEASTTYRQGGCFAQQRMWRVSIGFEHHVV